MIMFSIQFGISTNIWKLAEDVVAIVKLRAISFACLLGLTHYHPKLNTGVNIILFENSSTIMDNHPKLNDIMRRG